MLKKVISSLSVYTLTTLVSGLLGLIILPVLTKHLSEEDYGITALISTYVMLIGPLMGLSTVSYFWTEFFKEKDTLKLKKIFSTYFWFTLLCLLVLSIFFIIYTSGFELNIPYEELYFWLIPTIAFMSQIGELPSTLYINRSKPIRYAVFTIFFTALDLILSYYFVVYVFHSWEGRIVGWLLALLVKLFVTFLLFALVEKYILFTFSISLLKSSLVFSLPIIFHQYSKYAINESDRIFIAEMVSLEELGMYSVGYKIGTLLLIVVTAIGNFFRPFLFERLGDLTQIHKKEIVKMIYSLALILVIAFMGLNLFKGLLFDLLVDEKFWSGINYVAIISLSYLFWGGYMLYIGFLFYYQKTKYIGRIAVVSLFFNLGLNYLFIRNWGGIGAAYATLISYGILFFMVFFKANTLVSLPYLRLKN